MQAGVANLKSKINKQTPKAPVTPKAKYASLFASLDASTKKTSTKTANPLKSKPQKQSPAQNRKRKAQDNNEVILLVLYGRKFSIPIISAMFIIQLRIWFI